MAGPAAQRAGGRARQGVTRPRAFLPVIVLATALAPPPAGADYPQIRINSDPTTELQNEQQICVNPTNPANVVACWRDFRYGYRRVAVGASLDGGFTWADFLIPGLLPWDSDPVLTVHHDGTFYLSVVNFEPSGGPNQIAVHRSAYEGLIWDGPFSAVYTSGGAFEDKEWIAVDRTRGSRDGHLYVAWCHVGNYEIRLVRSTDRGISWSSFARVSDANNRGQWPVPIVLANGRVFVAWDDIIKNRIVYDISTNGGVSWGLDRVLATTGTRAGSVVNGGILVFPYPSLAVDETYGPWAGRLYCVYADAAVVENGMDIWVRSSSDNGVTWTVPVRVNDDPPGRFRDQFHPWVTCDEHGMLHATWYDRRDDPDNYLWHIYYSWSSDGGATWEPSERITDVPSSPAQASRGGAGPQATWSGWGPEDGPLALAPAGLIGEYSGVAAAEGIAHPVWTDTRNGNQDTYCSVVLRATAIETGGGSRRLVAAAAGRLRVTPNPAFSTDDLRLSCERPLSGHVDIFSADGRRLRSLALKVLPSGEVQLAWDGRDVAGRRVPGGVYFLRLVEDEGRGSGEVAAAKLTVVR